MPITVIADVFVVSPLCAASVAFRRRRRELVVQSSASQARGGRSVNARSGVVVAVTRDTTRFIKPLFFFLLMLWQRGLRHTHLLMVHMNLITACSNVYVHNPLNNHVAALPRGRCAPLVPTQFRAYVNHTRIKHRCESVARNDTRSAIFHRIAGCGNTLGKEHIGVVSRGIEGRVARCRCSRAIMHFGSTRIRSWIDKLINHWSSRIRPLIVRCTSHNTQIAVALGILFR